MVNDKSSGQDSSPSMRREIILGYGVIWGIAFLAFLAAAVSLPLHPEAAESLTTLSRVSIGLQLASASGGIYHAIWT